MTTTTTTLADQNQADEEEGFWQSAADEEGSSCSASSPSSLDFCWKSLRLCRRRPLAAVVAVVVGRRMCKQSAALLTAGADGGLPQVGVGEGRGGIPLWARSRWKWSWEGGEGGSNQTIETSSVPRYTNSESHVRIEKGSLFGQNPCELKLFVKSGSGNITTSRDATAPRTSSSPAAPAGKISFSDTM